jgi:hypothetical protein
MWALLGVVGAVALACGGARTEQATEFQRQRSGDVDVVLLSPRDGLRHGMDTFVIEFRTASGGNLIDAGVVNASAEMPMAGMPMMGKVDIANTEVAGRYRATGDLSMAGTWRLTIRWKGPAGQGSVTFPASVQ